MGSAKRLLLDWHGMAVVLAEGWRLCITGFPRAFPWVLMAELTQLLPFVQHGNIFTTDFSDYAHPGTLVPTLLLGALQAFCYACAVLKLATLDDTKSGPWLKEALRSILAVVVAYIVYELMMLCGFLVALVFFGIGAFVAGWQVGLVLCCLPLAPTAAASTALAFFMFPAVLERLGPFRALAESSRLAKKSWVQVSLVISVPALALLCLWCFDNQAMLRHLYASYIKFLEQMQDVDIMQSTSAEQLQGMLTSALATAEQTPGYAWQILEAVLGACVWWYTLAVCYAQYRALKQADSGK